MALNAFIGRMLTKERDIDACICDDEYCKFAIDTSHRPQKRRRRTEPSKGGDADGTDEPEGSGAAGHVAKHVLSALKAEMRLYDRALRQEARAERHVQNGQGSSGDSPAPLHQATMHQEQEEEEERPRNLARRKGLSTARHTRWKSMGSPTQCQCGTPSSMWRNSTS